MEKTKVEELLEQGATEALEKVLLPFIRGKLPSDKYDSRKVNAGLQLVSNYQRVVASREHGRGLNLVAIRMMTDDREATKVMIQKHFNANLQLPEPKK